MSLAAADIHVALRGRPVLHGVSLAVAAGEIVAVVGPNGAGKSTLLKTLAGLLAPAAGSVAYDGRPLAGLDRRSLGRLIAYLPQDRIVHWPMRVRSVVALGRLVHRGAEPPSRHAGDAHAIAAALAAMDVAAFAERSVGELSGGERARVLVARALAQEAAVLVADEPTAGLDPAHALALFGHFRQLAAAGRSVIVALHDLSLAARFADRVLLLREGRALGAGAPRSVFTPESLAAAYGIRATVAEIAGLPVVLPVEPLP
jgi:iron complex transport system ATP-binding protein